MHVMMNGRTCENDINSPNIVKLRYIRLRTTGFIPARGEERKCARGGCCALTEAEEAAGGGGAEGEEVMRGSKSMLAAHASMSKPSKRGKAAVLASACLRASKVGKIDGDKNRMG